ncbi:helix-turn-helix transcriptional regulator [Dactylosporangium sp. NPDC050688]|uniref:PadR family transcriptional regulator n=1 Tax=Dactylosporangium sp. NPDC050688 TaxID=3157217 RepID=UPI00340973E3
MSLREPTFLILTALAAEPQHGYSVLEDVRRISEDRVRLQAGTLYGILERLRGDGFIEVDREEVVASRLRRYYRLTTPGLDLLSAETDRLHRNAAAADRRLRQARLKAEAPRPAVTTR